MSNNTTYQLIKNLAEREKIEESQVVELFISAIQEIYQQKSTEPKALRVIFDEEEKQFLAYQIYRIVEEVKDPNQEITAENELLQNKKAKIQDNCLLLPLEDLKKIARKIIEGTVREVHSRYCLVNLLGSEGTETPKVGQQRRFLVKEVKKDGEYAINLVRRDEEFLRKLLEIEIPEIKQKRIIVQDILRQPGVISKIIVRSKDPEISPLGSCIGKGKKKELAVVIPPEQKSLSLTPEGKVIQLIENYLKIKILIQTPEEMEKKNQGITISQEQNIPPKLIENYCQSRGIKAINQKDSSFNSIIEEYYCQINHSGELISRPPVVSVMGHVDHGKTTFLDTIRSSRVQKEEKGGITQKISIYQVNFQEKKITFCDTPGHSDFIKMRQRGISLTDLVILIIDAKEGIMSQTREIINYLHEYKLPIIVFLNHKKPAETDNEANLTKLKSQLQEQGLTPME
ncbi:643_t:CDS:2 [Entrophospora sp. SA101]|nr:643_t:CDS:2 [Entrophospora sp. SA101]